MTRPDDGLHTITEKTEETVSHKETVQRRLNGEPLFSVRRPVSLLLRVRPFPPYSPLPVRLLILIAAFGLAGFGVQAPGAQTDSTTTQLADIEQQLARAVVSRDGATYSGFLADDWSVINTNGQILAKEEVLRQIFVTGERRLESMAVDEVKVRPLGEAAVVTGRTIATGSFRGTRTKVSLRFTDVFVRRDGRWQVVASQGTLIP